jgi:diaminopimelate epimerase
MILLSRRFYRAHGLGNDYLVCEALEPGGAAADGWPLTREAVVALCRRGWGEGSDGLVILLEREPGEGGGFPLRMFNPDGSEFERSGNGLRILASWLHREGLVGRDPFRVTSGGVDIPMRVHGVDGAGRYDISVDMGTARVDADAVEEVGWEGGAMEVHHPERGPMAFVPVWVGNPHAVVFVEGHGPAADEDLDGPLLRAVGPLLSTHPGFRRGTNVQLARVTPGGEVHIGIWERGVGRTSASGTSSCAAAVAAVATGRRPAGAVRVRMPGGDLQVGVSPGFGVTLRGPVQDVAEGELTRGFLARIGGRGPTV